MHKEGDAFLSSIHKGNKASKRGLFISALLAAMAGKAAGLEKC